MRDFYLKEDTLLENMRTVVMPYLNSIRRDGYFDGYDGNPIHYVKYIDDNSGPDAPAVIVSHGFTESTEKWHEMSYYFLRSGWNVYLTDHRGHGYSYREVEDPTLTHIDSFDEYVGDFEIFADTVRRETAGDVFLFAHSMGGAIGVLFMERHPDFFKKAVLSSPMIAPSSAPLPAWAARAILSFAVLLGKSKKRSFSSAPYSGEERFEDSLKTSEARFTEYELARRSDRHLQNYSMTYGWALNAMRVPGKILKKGRPEKIKTDTYMAIAGHDSLVLREPQLEFAGRAVSCRTRIYENAKHEIFGSEDETAFAYFDDVLGFYEG